MSRVKVLMLYSHVAPAIAEDHGCYHAEYRKVGMYEYLQFTVLSRAMPWRSG